MMYSWIPIINISIGAAGMVLSIVSVFLIASSRIMSGHTRFHLLWMFIITLLYYSSFIITYLASIIENITLMRWGMFSFSLFCSMMMPVLTSLIVFTVGESHRNNGLIICVSLLWVTYVGMLISTFFSPVFYSISDEGIYARGPWYPFLLCPPILIMLLNLSGMWSRRKKLNRNQIWAYQMFILVPLFAMVIQLFCSGISAIALGIMIGAATMYYFVQKDQEDKFIKMTEENANREFNIRILQIRPHFIYNVMSSIYYIVGEDPEKAQEVIRDFSIYLKRIFRSVGSPKPVAFSEELEHTRAYLSVEMARFADQIIVVINGPANDKLEQVCRDLENSLSASAQPDDPELTVLYTPEAGKRNALRLGLQASHDESQVTVLVDSDTLWTEGTLKNLLIPFAADPKIGGVTTRQKIMDPCRNIITMTAGLLEEIRAEGTMKAMSVTGKVGCLPGRTIAFRTSILRDSMDEFMTETFLGIHKEVSDDRSLTNITLKKGWKTVMQDTAVIYTDCPLTWKKFLRQQLRWAEGSQYNNLRMTAWMWSHARLMFFIYWCDMLMPFLLVSTWTTVSLCFLFRQMGFSIISLTYTEPVWFLILLMFVGAGFGVGVRNIRALLQLPPHLIFFLPFLTLVMSLVMAPLRILGIMVCADGLDWGTRHIEEGKPGMSESSKPSNKQYQRAVKSAVLSSLAVIILFSFGLELIWNGVF